MELLSEENVQFQSKLEFTTLTNPISRDIFWIGRTSRGMPMRVVLLFSIPVKMKSVLD